MILSGHVPEYNHPTFPCERVVWEALPRGASVVAAPYGQGAVGVPEEALAGEVQIAGVVADLEDMVAGPGPWEGIQPVVRTDLVVDRAVAHLGIVPAAESPQVQIVLSISTFHFGI